MTAAWVQPSQRRECLLTRWARQPGATFRYPSVENKDNATARNTAAPAAISLTMADQAMMQLIRFEQFPSDWDGNGAAKPLRDSLHDARQFIRALAPESTIPRPALHADGHAVLLLNTGDTYAELEFLGDKNIGFYARRGGEEWCDEFFLDVGVLPEGLSQIGFAVER
jgi:hypothetical protein